MHLLQVILNIVILHVVLLFGVFLFWDTATFTSVKDLNTTAFPMCAGSEQAGRENLLSQKHHCFHISCSSFCVNEDDLFVWKLICFWNWNTVCWNSTQEMTPMLMFLCKWCWLEASDVFVVWWVGGLMPFCNIISYVRFKCQFPNHGTLPNVHHVFSNHYYRRTKRDQIA